MSPKELVPILPTGDIRVCEFAINAMRIAGAERIVVAISPSKESVCDALGSGEKFGLAIEYVIQPTARGLPDVVRCAEELIRNCFVLFAMPDTVFLPLDALSVISVMTQELEQDVVLGLFPSDEPQNLAPVELHEGGEVARIYDKPKVTSLRNTWGVLAWSPRFTDFCSRYEQHRDSAAEGSLSAAMEAGRAQGLLIKARMFPHGVFLDTGTCAGLRSTQEFLKNYLIAEGVSLGDLLSRQGRKIDPSIV